MLELVSHDYATPEPCLVVSCTSDQCLAVQSAEGQHLSVSDKLFENEIHIFWPN
jgi:hypothetical protein